jgi:hypothetical protein
VPKKTLLDRMVDEWWGKAALGVFLLVIAWLMFGEFTQLEHGQVERVWAPKWVIYMYQLVGKWPPVINFGLLGAGATAWGIWQLASGKE